MASTARLDRAVGGDQHDAEVDLALPHLVQEGHAVHAGHPEVADGEAGASFSSRNSRAFRASSKVRTARPAFSKAMAIDSREPVSSSITRTRGLSGMRGSFWHRFRGDICHRLIFRFPMTLPFDSPRDPRRRDHPGRGAGAGRLLQRGERLERGAAARSPGYRDLVTAVGNLLGRAAGGEPAPRAGSWINDPKYGQQFRVASYATVTPATLDRASRSTSAPGWSGASAR